MKDQLNTRITADQVIELLSSRQEIEWMAAKGPSRTVCLWAPHLTPASLQEAARARIAYLDGLWELAADTKGT